MRLVELTDGGDSMTMLPFGMRALAFGEVLPDKRVVQCNYRVATAGCKAGARAYALDFKPAKDRVCILARSRGGRWIRKWETARRLTAFRLKTIPPEHTLYGRLYDTHMDQRWVDILNATSARMAAKNGGP